MAMSREPLHGNINRDFLAEVMPFLDSLDHDRSRRLVMPFDSPERFQWSFVPGERPGLMLRDMLPDQRKAAMRLVRTGLSDSGFATAQGIMALEEILAERKHDDDYDPLGYALSVFGNPEAGAPWAWRIDGHHLSLTFTIEDDETVVASPSFMGAHPAVLGHGIHSALADEEELGFAIIRGLPEALRGRALLSADAPREIHTIPGREDSLRHPVGLPLWDMPAEMRQDVLDLIEIYARRLHGPIADAEMARLHEAGAEQIRFAWMGAMEAGTPHYYRIHGPTLVIEFDNSRDGANHIHTVWHDPTREFVRDPLAEHLSEDH